MEINFNFPKPIKIELSQGIKGDQGVGYKTAKVNEEGELILTKTNGEVENAGIVKGGKGDKGDTGDAPRLHLEASGDLYVDE